MSPRCMRCGIGSGLVFQGNSSFMCKGCLDASREINDDQGGHLEDRWNSIEPVEFRGEKVHSLISELWE